MRLLLITLLLGSGTWLCTPATAQSDKDIRKEWAKKMKKMDPMEFKRIVEERQAALNEVEEARETVEATQRELGEAQQQAAVLRKEVKRLKAENSKLASRPVPTASAPAPAMAKTSAAQGVVYKVQIGAFRDRDLEKYAKGNPNFGGEVGADGVRRYTLGSFSDYWQANVFKKYLREMGVRDAWIVSFKNGQRVAIKDALEGVI